MDYVREFLALGLDSILFGICCNLFIKQYKAIKEVQNAAVVELDSSLEDRVRTEPDQKLPYVAVRGQVKALGAPVTSINNWKTTGTIQKICIKEHLIRRSSAGFWSTDHKRVIQEVYNSVPFVLQASKTSVEVLDAERTDILDLETTESHFEPSNPSGLQLVWGFFTGVQQRGVQTTEEMLKEGTFITGIGELALERSGLKLQAPCDGNPYYLTVLPLSSLIRKLDNEKRIYRFLTIILGGIGIVIIGIIAQRWWTKRARRLNEEAIRRQRDGSQKMRRRHVRDRELNELQQCLVCYQNPREIILLPCGHVCLCLDCSERINDLCPVCRAEVQTKATAYIA